MKKEIKITKRERCCTDKMYADFYYCPNCGGDMIVFGFRFCPDCGKALTWSKKINEVVMDD